MRHKPNHCGSFATALQSLAILFSLASAALAQDDRVKQRMDGFDGYMEKILKDWNAPGIGVAVVSGDRLVFAKGYGYRDYGKKLPFTSGTMMQIASNTKLFTAVAAGLLVNEGKLTWDRPVREAVPVIQFHSDHLNTNVTLRDMRRTAPASRGTTRSGTVRTTRERSCLAS